MSTSSPVRIRQLRGPSILPQPGNDRPPRGEAAVIVVRSLLLAAAAILVIATSNYFAYLIGRKQVAYEELRRQVDRVVQLIDHTRAEEDLSLIALKQRQDRFEQNTSSLTGLTTSTINGKTTATPDAPPAPSVKLDDTTATLPNNEARVPPSSDATAKYRDVRGVTHKRVSRRQKLPAPPGSGMVQPEFARQSGQPPIASASPDAGLAGQ